MTALQKTDYYPFGKTSPALVGENKYLYNDKELQDDLEQFDYGARLYDPIIGRWNVIDPLARYFEDISPYNYANNNPVLIVDLDGMVSEEKPKPKPIDLNEVVIKVNR